MTEDRNEWTSPDDEREAAIKHLVENTDLSPNQAKDLVAMRGTDRAKLMELAKNMKAEG
ncbi:hypothetical protein [Aliihoeflea sp. 2WW]|uniref:hypothetical protein n=1 Tax=Aliihoeflea sp. 2WW TaxID=1381123 RepID=UPI0004B0C8B1|nr:hypothetical protein [Aliihoeflea sp. 2WW]